jgi:hypothetical protein
VKLTGEEWQEWELDRLRTDNGRLANRVKELETKEEETLRLYEVDMDTRNKRIQELEERVAELRGGAVVAQGVMAEIRGITAERATWEVEAIRIRDKYMPIVEAAKNELRAAQKGLTSGCGCPIGVCLNPDKVGGIEPVCWAQWALTRAIVMAGTNALDKMKTDSMHPRRFTRVTIKS